MYQLRLQHGLDVVSIFRFHRGHALASSALTEPISNAFIADVERFVFRTRVLAEEVTPSLNVDDKHSQIKRYNTEGRALRTETNINDPRDFQIGKRRQNQPVLREVGDPADRR